MVASASSSRPVIVTARASKVSQLVGDIDFERKQPTLNLTTSRYKLLATDLGIPFWHKDRTYLLFGDSHGGGSGDAIGYTFDAIADKDLRLDFIHDSTGTYQPLTIPGIQLGDYEVPTEGVSVDGRMYVYATTDSIHGEGWAVMGRSVLAVSDDDGQSFKSIYDLSKETFINVSIEQVNSADWKGLPVKSEDGLVIFGSGKYRKSNVYLAFQSAKDIEYSPAIRYWSGLDSAGQPMWSTFENKSQPLFDQPCVGEFSVTYNRFIDKWIMLYNCDLPNLRGIILRTADQPWGPWSSAQIIFHPWDDQGYCHFMHASWLFRQCDQVNDPVRENVWGGEYGPYQFSNFATGDSSSTMIYFTMSTWNPYTVVLMKAELGLTAD
ncbi:MAG: DUF4185 domain-containing protein [Chloroflexi bacterium]|nr:DUF4185 domain-containing protein [Chloroflexota bacterium]